MRLETNNSLEKNFCIVEMVEKSGKISEKFVRFMNELRVAEMNEMGIL